MRVVHLIESLRAGGKERQLVELLKGLSSTPDIENELIIMSEEIHYSYVKSLRIKIHSLTRNSKKDPSIFYRLYSMLRKINPDLLHSWGSMCSVYALPAAKLLGVKFVNGFLRDAPPTLTIGHKDWLRCKLTFPFSDAIVANSHAGLHAYKAPVAKSVCIHNGFELERVANLPKRELTRKRFGIQTKKIVGMVATFSDRKDHTTFLNAAEKILAFRNDVTFVAVGDGENLASFQRKVVKKNNNRILFLGKQHDIEQLVNIFTIGILTSNTKIHREGISNFIMECMSLKKPVIATDCGGNNELVINGVTGFLIRPRDVDELVAKIMQLIDNQANAYDFGQRGYEQLCTRFNIDRMCQDYLALYCKVLQRESD